MLKCLSKKYDYDSVAILRVEHIVANLLQTVQEIGSTRQITNMDSRILKKGIEIFLRLYFYILKRDRYRSGRNASWAKPAASTVYVHTVRFELIFSYPAYLMLIQTFRLSFSDLRGYLIQ